MKPSFPKENPRKYFISEAAIGFISLCLKYNHAERPTPEEAYKHPYLKKD
jgi:serine/threonine protein kinase